MNISMPAFLERNSTAPLIAIGFGLAYLCMLVLLIPGYFVWDANTCLGLALIPYLSTANKGQLSLRYLLSAGVALIIAIMLPVNTLYFIAMVFALLLLIENWIGKISQVVLLLLLLISPVFKHLTHLVEFPVRLWLTEQVAGCLNAVGMKAIALGNQIQLDQYEFSVDPACAGLNMLVTSLIMCLFITAFYQRQLKRQLNFICLAGLCVITIVLNVVCNYFRILILVMFKIMPGTFLHDAVGLGCLVLYVIGPLMVSIRPILKRFGKSAAHNAIVHHEHVTSLRYPFLHFVFLIALILVSYHITKADNMITRTSNINIKGYHKLELGGGILKFEDQQALIYFKPTLFYAPEHDPSVCWVGSGYRFCNIRTELVAGLKFYTAILQKGKDKIYAAWWFDNGKTKTIDQVSWRWASAREKTSFYLVNVNALNSRMLRAKVTSLITQRGVINWTNTSIPKD